MEDFSVICGVRLDAETMVLLLLELNSPCLPHRQLLLGWQRLIPPSENRQRWMRKMSSRSDSSYPLVFVYCAPTPESTSSLISNVPCWLGVLGTRGE